MHTYFRAVFVSPRLHLVSVDLLWCLTVAEHIRGPFLEAVASGQVRSMPNNFLAPSPVDRRGVMCLGDALNMRHPLTGAGMTVALNDVIMVRELLRGVDDLRDYSTMMRASRSFYLRRKLNHSFTVNVLSVALYELFAAGDGQYHQSSVFSAAICYGSCSCTLLLST